MLSQFTQKEHLLSEFFRNNGSSSTVFPFKNLNISSLAKNYFWNYIQFTTDSRFFKVYLFHIDEKLPYVSLSMSENMIPSY